MIRHNEIHNSDGETEDAIWRNFKENVKTGIPNLN